MVQISGAATLDSPLPSTSRAMLSLGTLALQRLIQEDLIWGYSVIQKNRYMEGRTWKIMAQEGSHKVQGQPEI